MRRSRQEHVDRQVEFGDPGDLWHALARLHATHPELAGRSAPFAPAQALLSLTETDDVLFTARVELSGTEPMGHLHDLIHTVTRGITADLGHGGPGVAMEVLVGKRQELALHAAHVEGLTQLLRHATGTIGARNTPGGGRCYHCDGTGLARPLWEPTPGAG